MQKLFWSSFIICGIALRTISASWYLDSAAVGSNNGTSWTDAWTTPAAVVWGGAGVVAGDTLWVSAGSSGQKLYSTNFVVGAGGTVSSPITIRVGQDATHGGGTAVVTNGWLLIDSRAWIVVDGRVGSRQALRLGGGAAVQYHAFCKRSSGPIKLYGLSLVGTNTTFKHGIRFDLESSVTTSNVPCEIGFSRFEGLWGDNISCIDGGESKGFGTDMLIFSNTITGGGGNGIVIQGNTDVFGNEIVDPDSALNPTEHRDGIEPYGGNLRIWGNLIRNFHTTQIMLAPFDTQSTNWHNVRVYNNLFLTTITNSASQRGVQVYFTPVGGATPSNRNIHATNWVLANNTFVGFPYFGLYMRVRENTYTNVVLEDFRIVNNLIQDSGDAGTAVALSDVNDHAGMEFANNNISGTDVAIDWFGTPYADAEALDTGEGTLGNLSDSVTLNGYDLDPTDIGARNLGQDLSNIFVYDYAGRLRDLPWDIGAYEYVGRRATAGTVNVGTLNITP